MAKKKLISNSNTSPNRPETTRTELLERIKGAQLYVSGIKQHLTPTVEGKTELKSAIQWWQCLPLYLDLLVDDIRKNVADNDQFQGDISSIEAELFEGHKAAVELLSRLAESMNFDSTPISVAGLYCRELMSGPKRASYFRISETHFSGARKEFWPSCLGSSLFEMPADVRQVITVGNGLIDRLACRSRLTNTESVNPSMNQNTIDNLSDRDNDPRWTDWLRVKPLKRHFGFERSGWTGFANKYQDRCLLEKKPDSGDKIVRVNQTVFAERNVPFIPKGSQIPG